MIRKKAWYYLALHFLAISAVYIPNIKLQTTAWNDFKEEDQEEEPGPAEF